MLNKNKILFLFLAFVVTGQGVGEIYSKNWLITCTHCSIAFSSCLSCFGERACKS